jgi:hypothetical protein
MQFRAGLQDIIPSVDPPKMFVCDRLGQKIDTEAIRREKLNAQGGVYAVLDLTRRLTADDAGPVVALFSGQKAFEKASKAAKRIKHSRVVRLKGNRQFRQGDHINCRSEIEFEHTARFG